MQSWVVFLDLQQANSEYGRLHSAAGRRPFGLYAPPALMRVIAQHIKGAQFIAVPEAAHSVWWETPDEFNRAVLTFFAKY